jgi:hypothetical protein
MVIGWLGGAWTLSVLAWVFLVFAEEVHHALLRKWRRVSNNAPLLETLAEVCLHGSFYGAAIFAFFADQVGFALFGPARTLAVIIWLVVFIYAGYEIKRVLEDLHATAA